MTFEATDATPDTTEDTTPESKTDAAPAEETAPAEAEGTEAAEASGDEGGDASADEAAQAEEGKRKRAGGWQRKIERLEREKDALYQQLMQRPGQAPTAQAPKDQTPEERAAAYIDGLVEQRLTQREAQAREAAAQADFAKRAQEVRALHPDFDEVVMGVEHIPVPPALQRALLTSEVGPRIMYELASNPAELARISALPPIDAAREIGRLEARASGTATPKQSPKPATRKAAAPAPITPVTARGPTTVKSVSQMSYEEYNAWRDSQKTKR